MPDHPLSPGGETFALLDTSVLLPPRLSDVLFDLAGQKLFHPRWSAKIENEFLDNWADVVTPKPALPQAVTGRVQVYPQGKKDGALHRLNCFKAAAGREHQVPGYDAQDVLSKVPPGVHRGDRHLVAAALVLRDALAAEGETEGTRAKVVLVSANTRHLAVKDTEKLGVDVMTPGEFIDTFLTIAKSRVEKALKKAMADLTNPPYTKEQLLAALRLHGANETAAHFAKEWKVKMYATR